MTGSKHNHEGNSSDKGEPGPYWGRVHRDWRFWFGALLMGTALAWVTINKRDPSK